MERVWGGTPRFELNVNCENADFYDENGELKPEKALSAILREIADTLEYLGEPKPHGFYKGIYNTSGNQVGTWRLSDRIN